MRHLWIINTESIFEVDILSNDCRFVSVRFERSLYTFLYSWIVTYKGRPKQQN